MFVLNNNFHSMRLAGQGIAGKERMLKDTEDTQRKRDPFSPLFAFIFLMKILRYSIKWYKKKESEKSRVKFLKYIFIC